MFAASSKLKDAGASVTCRRSSPPARHKCNHFPRDSPPQTPCNGRQNKERWKDTHVGLRAAVERGPSDSLFRYFKGVVEAALYCAHRTIKMLLPRLLVVSPRDGG